MAGQEAFQRVMAPQGGLGWAKDSATASYEELREAALSRCPKQIKWTLIKCPFIFIYYWFFGRGDSTYWTREDEQTNGLEEREEQYGAKTGTTTLSFSATHLLSVPL